MNFIAFGDKLIRQATRSRRLLARIPIYTQLSFFLLPKFHSTLRSQQKCTEAVKKARTSHCHKQLAFKKQAARQVAMLSRYLKILKERVESRIPCLQSWQQTPSFTKQSNNGRQRFEILLIQIPSHASGFWEMKQQEQKQPVQSTSLRMLRQDESWSPMNEETKELYPVKGEQNILIVYCSRCVLNSQFSTGRGLKMYPKSTSQQTNGKNWLLTKCRILKCLSTSQSKKAESTKLLKRKLRASWSERASPLMGSFAISMQLIYLRVITQLLKVNTQRYKETSTSPLNTGKMVFAFQMLSSPSTPIDHRMPVKTHRIIRKPIPSPLRNALPIDILLGYVQSSSSCSYLSLVKYCFMRQATQTARLFMPFKSFFN